MIISLDTLKTYFEAYDRPSATDFSNLIDTLSTEISIRTEVVPVGSFDTIHESFNENLTLTLSQKELVLLQYTDGVYVFNVMTPGTYGNNGIQVSGNDCVHIAPSIDIINDVASGTGTTYSSEYIDNNFKRSSDADNEYLQVNNPQTIHGDVSVDGDMHADNMPNVDTLGYSDSLTTAGITFTTYDSTTRFIEIKQHHRPIFRQVADNTGDVVTDFNNLADTSRTFDARNTVYIEYIHPDGEKTIYLITAIITDGQPLTINNSVIKKINDEDTQYLVDNYYDKNEIDYKLNQASLGLTYSVSNYDDMASISSPATDNTCLIRHTVTDADPDTYYDNNRDANVASYSDAVESNGYYYIYSPVYKYDGSAWQYSYQMAAPHTHPRSAISDAPAYWLNNDLSLINLADLSATTASEHLTNTEKQKIADSAIDSEVVHKSGAETIDGDKTIDGEIIMNQLNTDEILITDSYKHIKSEGKNTAFNKDFGTASGTVAEGDHTHAQYALDTDVVHKAGENQVGNIGIGMDCDTNAKLSVDHTMHATQKVIVGTDTSHPTDTTMHDGVFIEPTSIEICERMPTGYIAGYTILLSNAGNIGRIQYGYVDKILFERTEEVDFPSGIKTDDKIILNNAITTTDTNFLVRSDSNNNEIRTYQPDSWHYVGDSGEPAFLNDWENAGLSWTQNMRFKKDMAGNVHIQGQIKNGTDYDVFQLPAGYVNSTDISIPIYGRDPSTGDPAIGYALIYGTPRGNDAGMVRVINYNNSGQSIFITFALD